MAKFYSHGKSKARDDCRRTRHVSSAAAEKRGIPRYSYTVLPPPRLLAIDLDGTLFNSRQQISPRNAAAIHAARRAGIEICIATGRRHTFAWRNLAALALAPTDIILSANGTVVRQRDGLLLHRTQLSHETSVALCALAGEHRAGLVFTFDKVDNDPAADHHAGSLLVESVATLPATIARWVSENRGDFVEMAPLETGLAAERATQAMICGDFGRMRDVERQLKQSHIGAHLAIHRTEYPSRSLAFLDLLPAGCGKGAALAQLATQRGFDASQVVAIGDNFNDLDMLHYAGRAYIMANGAPELVAAAAERGWTVAPSNEEDGVAVAIEELLDKQAAGTFTAEKTTGVLA
jgi:Cof subfamily protein (haloacid dehalogenase superfamily)